MIRSLSLAFYRNFRGHGYCGVKIRWLWILKTQRPGLYRSVVTETKAPSEFSRNKMDKQYQVEDVIRLLETVMEDDTKRKLLLLPRSFPFIDNKQLYRNLLVGCNQVQTQFKFLIHVLNPQLLSVPPTDNSQFILMAKEFDNGSNLENMVKYVSQLSRSQFKSLKTSLLRASQEDNNHFQLLLLPIIKYIFKEGTVLDHKLSMLLDPSHLYEIIVPTCIHNKQYDLAISYHKALITIISANKRKINWQPVILAAMLDDGTEGLSTLMKIHFTLDRDNDGFFDHVIPFFQKNCKEWDVLIDMMKWTSVLVMLGDIPKYSSPNFDSVILILLKHGFDKSVMNIFHHLRSARNLPQIGTEPWASEQLINDFMKIVNFRQVKNQDQFIEDLVDSFSHYNYIKESSFWSQLLSVIEFRDKESQERIVYQINNYMSDFNVTDYYDVYSLECIKSKDDNVFLNNFDILINYHDLLKLKGISRAIPLKVLGRFIKILAMNDLSSTPFDKDLSRQSVDEAFTILRKHIAAGRKAVNLQQQNGLLSLCYELSKEFLQGVSLNRSFSKIEKLSCISELEAFIYNILLDYPEALNINSRRHLVLMECQIIKFRLSAGEIDQSLTRIKKLLDNIDDINKGSKSKINVHYQLSSHMVGIVSHKIIDNLNLFNVDGDKKYLVRSQSLLLRTFRILVQLHGLNPVHVSATTWSHFLVATSKIRPFEEIEILTWWLVKNVGTQSWNEIKVKSSHTLHPLMQLFSLPIVSQLLRLAFTTILEDEIYEPWKTLELLLKVSDITGLYLDYDLIEKEVTSGIRQLYRNELKDLSPAWKRARVQNTLDLQEMMDYFNLTWKTNFCEDV